MKTLIFNDDEFKAERIVKTSDSLIGYNGDVVVFKFSGVSDFNAFTLTDGREFDLAEQSAEEKLRLEMARSNAEMFEMMISMLGGGV